MSYSKSILIKMVILIALFIGTLTLAGSAGIKEAFAEETSGSCGEKATWSYNVSKNELDISGSGAISDFSDPLKTPWHAYAKSAKTVIIEEGITAIGQNAFHGLEAMTKISIPTTLEKSSAGAFSLCKKLTNVDITDLAAWCEIEFATEESNPLYFAQYLRLDGKKVVSLEIPEGVTKIGNYAFVANPKPQPI